MRGDAWAAKVRDLRYTRGAMAGPQELLRDRVREAVVRAFGPEHAGIDPAVRRSQFADYQADVALRLAKPLRQKPLQIAETLRGALQLSDVAEVSVSPPGFVNFRFTESYLEQQIAAVATDERCGVQRAAELDTVVIDYSSPNVAKEMHVGHLRSTVIGDALARTLRFLGHEVILQNHIGDWGTPFGMLIEHMQDVGTAAAEQALSLGSLNEFYRAAREKFDQSPEFQERARQRVVLLQGGDPATLEAWRSLSEASRRYFVSIYERLGVLLRDDDVRGESFYNPSLPEIARDLAERGLARVDQDALCAFPPGFTGKDGEPLPLIIRKGDGGFGYAATDLAAVRFRVQELGATRILVVVGAPQQQHLSMVFATARLAGYLPEAVRVEHVMFGSVLGPDRKMFKSRSGESVKLASLLDEAIDRAEKAVRESRSLSAEEARRIAAEVGIGAIKYADLSSDRIKDYIFDWDRMLSFEGNTGPYLQYAHARIVSIEQKARAAGLTADPSVPIVLSADEERALCLELFELGPAITAVAETLQPHRLCHYLYELSSKFTAFYENCPVLRADTDALKASRLRLVATTRRALALGLDLLGISAPERM